MKCVTYNIHFGVGPSGRYDLGPIIEAVKDADVIALQEVSRNLPLNQGADMPAEIEAALPGHFSVFGAGMDAGFASHLHKGRAVQMRSQFGNMVLSRWPILVSRNLLLPKTRSYDRLNLERCAVEALVVTPSGPLRFYSVHLDHTRTEERMAQIAFLKAKAFANPDEGAGITGGGEMGFPEPPIAQDFVMMGDFNFQPDWPEYAAMTGAVDPLEGWQRTGHHLADISTASGGSIDAMDTYADFEDPAKNSRIDYGFVSAGLYPRVSGARVDEGARGSDHLPVWFALD